MVGDAFDELDDPEPTSDELATDYYKDLHRIHQKQAKIHAHRALEDYVPLVAALGPMIITAMVLFKGLEH